MQCTCIAIQAKESKKEKKKRRKTFYAMQNIDELIYITDALIMHLNASIIIKS